MDLLQLAERCEKASGPDRELEWRIAEAIGVGEWRQSAVWPPFMPGSKIDKSIPTYTASLDAAMTLVPEKAVISLAHQERWKKPAWAWGINDGYGVTHFGNAATPSQALCAAALRARAAKEPSHD
jgi:hypothetical protein